MHAVEGWEDCDEVLPTVPGCVVGIVAKAKGSRGTVLSAQCSTCLRVFTGPMIQACRSVNFAPHKPYSAAEPFRRCAECREADRLPDNADELRERERLQHSERGEVVRSDVWREACLIEGRISSTPEERNAAMQAMRTMLQEAHLRAEQRWLDMQ